MKVRLAIIGAGYLQKPLVKKALELGIETHVFAWREGCVVEDVADFYYPISILEKEEILKICREVKIDGITSIASDIAMPTVNYIADQMGLVGNSIESTNVSTNKYNMRSALRDAGIRTPEFTLCDSTQVDNPEAFNYPVIVKPVDRSGSRGVSKVDKLESLTSAIQKSLGHSLTGQCIIEEYITGKEYSVESISHGGRHYVLAVTEKVTSGPPYFVELEHHQPAELTDGVKLNVTKSVIQALNALSIENGASHSEIFIGEGNQVIIGEVGGRMGGDFIGSHLVQNSTGYDYLKGVIDVALDRFEEPMTGNLDAQYSGVYFSIPDTGVIKKVLDRSKDIDEIQESVVLKSVGEMVEKDIQDSSMRAGVIVYRSSNRKLDIKPEKVLEFVTSKEQ